MRWHCSPDTGFEIWALAVWGRARYLSVTEAPHNTDFHTWMGKKHFCFFQTAETGNRTPNSGVKNHYPRVPAPCQIWACVYLFGTPLQEDTRASRATVPPPPSPTSLDIKANRNAPAIGRHRLAWEHQAKWQYTLFQRCDSVDNIGPTLRQQCVLAICEMLFLQPITQL